MRRINRERLVAAKFSFTFEVILVRPNQCRTLTCPLRNRGNALNMNKKTIILGIMLSAAWLPSAHSQATIPNPSFELPGFTDPNAFIILGSGSTYITDWTVGAAGLDYFRFPGGAGQYFVDLVRGPGEGGSITTTISGLTSDASYQLTFD